MRALLLVLVLAGCAAPAAKDPSCCEVDDPVCKYYNDLGCICVKVQSKTPSCTYKGKSYYFCSENCRKKFMKDPEKFLAAQ